MPQPVIRVIEVVYRHCCKWNGCECLRKLFLWVLLYQESLCNLNALSGGVAMCAVMLAAAGVVGLIVEKAWAGASFCLFYFYSYYFFFQTSYEGGIKHCTMSFGNNFRIECRLWFLNVGFMWAIVRDWFFKWSITLKYAFVAHFTKGSFKGELWLWKLPNRLQNFLVLHNIWHANKKVKCAQLKSLKKYKKLKSILHLTSGFQAIFF